MMCLMEFGGACLWFDTSIFFSKNYKNMVSKHVYNRKSSIVFYIHSTGHSLGWATHPEMISFLPSNVTEMTIRKNFMLQGGALVVYNW